MLFNTFPYWAFFIVTTLLFYAVPFRVGKWVLFISSCLFYMLWNPYFILLLGAIIILDFYAGILIDSSEGKKRFYWLLISLIANLGILAFFKYYNFFVANIESVLDIEKGRYALDIILPLGISFHTFQSMSYTIDVYRRTGTATRSFLDFSLFVTFFPQLVAGPIVRAKTFFPELENWTVPSRDFIVKGISLVFVGLIKKSVFADHFALISDAYFNHLPSHPGSASAIAGVTAFAMQIFFDFSGYTDIARGCAYILGWDFPLNFARPYLSQNITEFWRRWHISLSSWLRDYLYISLGGNRHGVVKTYRNLFITMLLGGFWHGASWNFVIWGAFHGIMLSLHRVLVSGLELVGLGKISQSRIFLPAKVVFTFAVVCIGWVFFRATTFHDSVFVISNLFEFGTTNALPLWHVGATIMLLISIVGAVLEEKYSVVERFNAAPTWVKVLGYTAALLVLQLFAYSKKDIPFIYFQF